MPIRILGADVSEVRYLGASAPNVFYPLTPGESNNHQNALFTNTAPTVMISASNASPSPGDTVTFTATAVDPDVPPQDLTFVWSVDSVVQATNTVSSLTNTFDHTRTTAGSATISVSVTDSAGAGPVTDSDTIEWASSFTTTLTASLQGGFSYPGTGSVITLTGIPGMSTSGLPTTDTLPTTFTIRDGGVNWANQTQFLGFGGVAFATIRLSGNDLICTCSSEIEARNIMAVADAENGWFGSAGSTAWTDGFGGLGFNYFTQISNSAPNTANNNITIIV